MENFKDNSNYWNKSISCSTPEAWAEVFRMSDSIMQEARIRELVRAVPGIKVIYQGVEHGA